MKFIKKLFSPLFKNKPIPDIKYPNEEPYFIMYDNPIRKKVDNTKRIEHTKPESIIKGAKKSHLNNNKLKEVRVNEKSYFRLTSPNSQELKPNPNINKPNLALIKKSLEVKTNTEKSNLIENSKFSFNSSLEKQQPKKKLISSIDLNSNDKVETKTTITEKAFKQESDNKYSSQNQNYSIGFKSHKIPTKNYSSQKSSTHSGYDFKSTENMKKSSGFTYNPEISQIGEKPKKSSGHCSNLNLNENQASSSGFSFTPDPVTYSFGFKNNINHGKPRPKENSSIYTGKIESSGFKYNSDFGKQQSNLSGYKFIENSGISTLNEKPSKSSGFSFNFANQQNDKHEKQHKVDFNSISVNFKPSIKNDYNSTKKKSSGFTFNFDPNSQTKEKSFYLPSGFKSQSTGSNSSSGYNFNHSENSEGIKLYQQSESNGSTQNKYYSDSYGSQNIFNDEDKKTEKKSVYKFNYNLSNSNSNQIQSSERKFKFTYNSDKTRNSDYKFESNSQKKEISPTTYGFNFSLNSNDTQRIANDYNHLTEQSSGYNFSINEEKPIKPFPEFFSNTSITQNKGKHTKSPSGFNFVFKD